jgi:uncharacterized membrane protein YphA (DoxX/SURF4 family)
MDLALRIIVGAFALLFIFMGVGFLFDPAGSAANVAVTPIGEPGLNTLRGDMAGLFLGSAVLLLIGIFRRRGEWLLAVAVLMVAIAVGRVVGFALDGNPTPTTLAAFGFEVVIAAVLLVAARVLPARAGGPT